MDFTDLKSAVDYINSKYTNRFLFWDSQWFNKTEGENKDIHFFLLPNTFEPTYQPAIEVEVIIESIFNIHVNENNIGSWNFESLDSRIYFYLGRLDSLYIKKPNKLQFLREGYAEKRLYFEFDISSSRYKSKAKVVDKEYYEKFAKYKSYIVEHISQSRFAASNFKATMKAVLEYQSETDFIVLWEYDYYADLEYKTSYPLPYNQFELYKSKYMSDKYINVNYNRVKEVKF